MFLTAAPSRLLLHSTPCQQRDHLSASHKLTRAASWGSQLLQDNPCQSHPGALPASLQSQPATWLPLYPVCWSRCHLQKTFSVLAKINFYTEPLSLGLNWDVFESSSFRQFAYFVLEDSLSGRLRCFYNQKFDFNMPKHYLECKQLNLNFRIQIHTKHTEFFSSYTAESQQEKNHCEHGVSNSSPRTNKYSKWK